MRVQVVGAVALAVVAAVGLAGCGGGSEKPTNTGGPSTNSTTTTPPPPPPELKTIDDVRRAVPNQCPKRGGDLNQVGTEAGGKAVDKYPCALTPGGSTTFIIYHWKSGAMPAALDSALKDQFTLRAEHGRSGCLQTSKAHSWALAVLDPSVVKDFPDSITSDVETAAGTC